GLTAFVSPGTQSIGTPPCSYVEQSKGANLLRERELYATYIDQSTPRGVSAAATPLAVAAFLADRVRNGPDSAAVRTVVPTLFFAIACAVADATCYRCGCGVTVQ